MPRLYTRPSSVLSGEPVDGVFGDGDGDGFGVLATVAGESCSLLVASSVLAASVVIWEACAFAALAAVLVAGATWSLSVVAGAGAGRAAAAAAPAGRAASGARGLAEIDISALPKSPYQQQHRRLAGGDGVTCAVCLEDLRGGEMVRRLPGCRHVFHVGCIDAWLQMHVTCPLCRSDLSPRRAAVGSPAHLVSPHSVALL